MKRYNIAVGSVMSTNGTDGRPQAEQLMREAIALYEQGRLEEALLACEGALALDEKLVPALSLKGLIHERRGQIQEAIEAYQRVQALNPLSVSERARLEALLRQQRAAVRPATRPLWRETLPVIIAFLGAGLVLLIGLAIVLRTSTPAPAPMQAATVSEPEPTPVRPASEPRVPPPPAEAPAPTPPPQPIVPPVLVDPSRVALAPSEPPAAPRGNIPTLPAPSTSSAPTSNAPKPEAEKPASAPNTSEVMPDVKVEETQRGVYRISVRRVGNAEAAPNRTESDLLRQARDHQRAGNYREAIQAYLQALPNAPNPAEVHQQIAICYLRLGEKANARAHFLQAIAEYERQIQAGRDGEAARQGIQACQDGLQLCNE